MGDACDSTRMTAADPLQRLLDREEIRELRYRYAYCVDREDWDGFLDLFADDATLSFPDLDYGPFEGEGRLREFAADVDEGRQFNAHMVHNPLIDVDGDEPTGTWVFEVAQVDHCGRATWVQGWYDERYRRTDEGWKFASIEIHVNYRAPYDEEWADRV